MDEFFKQTINETFSKLNLISAEILVGIKLTSFQHRIWISSGLSTTNERKMKDELATDGLRFADGDEFYEQNDFILSQPEGNKNPLDKESRRNQLKLEKCLTSETKSTFEDSSDEEADDEEDLRRKEEKKESDSGFSQSENRLKGAAEVKDVQKVKLEMDATNSPSMDPKRIGTISRLSRRLRCAQCLASFEKPSELKTHLKSHATNVGGKSLKEPQVPKKKYMKHKRSGQRYLCSYCPKSFQGPSGVKRHLKTHAGVKPFKCLQCEKSFFDSYSLRLHLRIHTGEKPFQCSQCPKAFRQRPHFICHLRTHTGEKPYKCLLCEKSFIQNNELKSHVRSHTGETPYKCTQCPKAFKQSIHLKLHLQNHNGGRRFQCEICLKLFGQAGGLRIHLRSHTGERPFSCLQCEKSFKQPDKLKRHLLTHAKEKHFGK